MCTEHAAQNYTGQNHPTDPAKTGLGFQLRVECSAYLKDKRYRSRYNVSVVLQNGGTGWRVGDEVTVQQNGRTYTIRVTGEALSYTYASDGTATHTTPADSNSGTLDIGAITAGLVNCCQRQEQLLS